MVFVKQPFIIAVLLGTFVFGCASLSHDDGDTSLAGHHADSDTSHWQVPESETLVENPYDSTQFSLVVGRITFQQECTDCHGTKSDNSEDFEDAGSPPYFTKLGLHSAEEMAWKIKTGRGDMPSWGKQLTKGQIWNLVNYLKSIQ